MSEIAPGLWHWIALRERIGAQVSSYYLEVERVIIDPMIPPEGLGFFEARGAPEHGLYELEGRGPVEPFDFGDALPGDIHVHEVGAICPDETALHLPRHRALAVADGVVRWRPGDALEFVPDSLMDDPDQTKEQLREAYRRMLELDFELLLLAHGDPVSAGGREALRAFVERSG